MDDRRSPDHPTDLDEYLFDLRGYVVLEGALDPDLVDQLNEAVDPAIGQDPGTWYRNAHRTGGDGETDLADVQQVYELPPWEQLIAHPSWIAYVKRFVGNQDDFDAHHGPVYIDENFVRSVPTGNGTPIHSGGHKRTKRTQYRYHNHDFHCGQVNVLVALTDVGPGDGATMAVPGSHKQNLEPPFFDDVRGDTLEDVPGAEEIHLDAGDALLFVDCLMHGSATRTTPGHRRFAVFRYGPSWGVSRHGYAPSDALLERLSDEERAIVKTWGTVEPKTPDT